MPITWPSVLTRGPPELPGEMEASVCSHRLYWLCWGRKRRVQEMMPMETERDSPQGAPMAMTKSPSFNCEESPNWAMGRAEDFSVSWSCTRARSVSLSEPTSLASKARPSYSRQRISTALSTTCQLVSTSPLVEMMTPLPATS